MGDTDFGAGLGGEKFEAAKKAEKLAAAGVDVIKAHSGLTLDTTRRSPPRRTSVA